MVLMTYKGAMATGLQVATQFELAVEKGKSYDIPERLVKDLLKTGEWVLKKEEGK